ncbi:ABC transporter ATP-binding protein [Bifidobacterium sp. BRDM6]|uniref:Fatty acid ABC transporter ATP-binding/permease protein n=2 Tax=Bifidobacterium choloepi TaxID=2614131 RepID=A0A6I5NG36_9BIFI|nr:ABC transporter ATP-binding protein [Bifidobacterium choloepi]
MLAQRDAVEEPSGAPKHAWATTKRLARQFSNQRLRLAAVLVSTVLYTGFHVAGPAYSAIVINTLWADIQRSWTTGESFKLTFANGSAGLAIAVYAAILLLEWLFYYIQILLVASVAEKLNLTLREQIAAKLGRLPLGWFDDHRPGETLSRVTNDLDRISETMQNGLVRLLQAVLNTVVALVIMAYYSWVLTLVFLLFVALNLLITKSVAEKNLAAASRRQRLVGELTGMAEEYYQGRQVIKASNREAASRRDFGRLTEQVREVSQYTDFLTNCVNPLVRMVNRFAQVAIALLAAWMMAGGRMSIGVAQAYFQYVVQIGEPITEATFVVNSLQSSLASAERTFELLDAPEERPDPAPGDALAIDGPVHGRVEFADVSFGYDPSAPLMRGVSFVAEPGTKVAIVGQTGAGKTTLVNLLLRFYEIDGGAITLDGVDTARMTRAELRSHFGMVLQDTWLFGGTVAENIAYGRPDASRDEIVAAAKAAHADFFIRTLPHGYDTMLDNEAANLSAGQCQLLTIARVFLADPAMLVFDEATSSVDTRTEAAISHGMDALMKGRTSFVIAHRLSTVLDADLILYMEHGDILEHGTHADLMARNGRYAAMYNAQFA